MSSMSDHVVMPKVASPGTEFICALFKMTVAQRQQASAERAAERYGLPLEECRYWIEHAKRVDEKWPIRGGGK